MVDDSHCIVGAELVASSLPQGIYPQGWTCQALQCNLLSRVICSSVDTGDLRSSTSVPFSYSTTCLLTRIRYIE